MTETSEASSERQDKVVTMPEAQNMVKKLTDAGLINMDEESDRVMKKYIQKVAGTNKVGAGLAMAWSLAIYDELKDYPPQIQGVMSMYFDIVIDASTPDPEVAKEAKDFMARVREKANESY